MTGQVAYNGAPVTGAHIEFLPVPTDPKDQAPGPPSGSPLDSQGRFDLATRDQGRGAVVGKNRVTISYEDPNNPNQGSVPPEFVVDVPAAGLTDLKIQLQPRQPDDQ